jgi:Outer membrane protein beta-barrel domain
MFRKLLYPFCLLCVVNNIYAQEIKEKKWITGISLSGCYTAMTANASENANVPADFALGNDRFWEFDYKAGLMAGIVFKRNTSKMVYWQFEANLVWSRQTLLVAHTPLTRRAALEPLFVPTALTGAININNVYLQIPIILNVRFDSRTNAEFGLFANNILINTSTQDVTTTTFTEFDSKTGQVIRFSPPRMVKNTVHPDGYGTLGWLLGISHRLNDRIFVNFRYERSLLGIAGFSELRERRMSVGVIFKTN